MANLIQIAKTIAAAITGPTYKLKPNAVFDFSEWEDVPDWSKVVFPNGTKALITKATDGKEYIDKTFRTNFEAFGKMPYWRGGYHFFQPNDIAGQINNYLNQMQIAGWKKEDYPPILDVEWIPPDEKKKKPDHFP